jgi:hypothetical protein
VKQVRPLRWHDLPLAYRLIGHGSSFDVQFSLTIGKDGLRHNLLANFGNTHTFVLRDGGGALAVLRGLAGTQCAGLGYIAPALDRGGSEGQWLALISGMGLLAGQRGIAAIRAEVGDDTPEFAALRECDFGIYAHQTLWERPAGPVDGDGSALRAASADEVASLMSGWDAHTPSLLRQANVLPGMDAECYVLDVRHSAHGVAAIYRNGQRALVDLYAPLDAHEAARGLIDGLMDTLGAETTAITCRLRHDMEWLGRHLTDAGFEWLGPQAVMVRHTLAHIRQHTTKELAVKRGMALPTTHIRGLEPAGPGVPEATIRTI